MEIRATPVLSTPPRLHRSSISPIPLPCLIEILQHIGQANDKAIAAD